MVVVLFPCLLLLGSPPCEVCRFSLVPHLDDNLVVEAEIRVVMVKKEEEEMVGEEMCGIFQPFSSSLPRNKKRMTHLAPSC